MNGVRPHGLDRSADEIVLSNATDLWCLIASVREPQKCCAALGALAT
jgi:hypothetical protein